MTTLATAVLTAMIAGSAFAGETIGKSIPTKVGTTTTAKKHNKSKQHQSSYSFKTKGVKS